MQNFLIILFLVIFCNAFGQTENLPVVNKNGKDYYVYTVKKGNTLYSLQRKFDLTLSELQADNPDLNENLSEGQQIYIHKPLVLVDYKVQKGETIYGLTKKFKISTETLLEYNPELENGLKKGQTIKVPGEKSDFQSENKNTDDTDVVDTPVLSDTVSEFNSTVNPFGGSDQVQVDTEIVTFNDSIVYHQVLKGETMYQISKRYMVTDKEVMKWNGLRSTRVSVGQELKIILKVEKTAAVLIKPVPGLVDSLGNSIFKRKSSYNIVYLLPFHFNFGKNYSKQVSSLATQFYMGAKMAVDSLANLGLRAKVHFLDTENDSTVIKGLIKSEVLLNADLIVGPLLKNGRSVVAEFCRFNKIRMVIPVSAKSQILESNTFVYNTVSSNNSLMNGLAENNTREKTNSIILVKPKDKEGAYLFQSYKLAYENIGGISKPKLIVATPQNFNTFLDKKEHNVVVYLTKNESQATKFFSELNKVSVQSKIEDVQVYGLKDWVKFDQINDNFKNKYHFRYATSSFVDYYDSNMMNMNLEFREEYNTDFSTIAIQGFDVSYYFLSSFFLPINNLQLLMNNFEMKQVSFIDGFRNENVFIIEQDQYKLRRVLE